MAFVEPYEKRYDYVPFKNKWYVDCRPKKHLLKNSVVDKDVLEKMSTQDLMSIVNARNIKTIEKIIEKRVKLQNRLAKVLAGEINNIEDKTPEEKQAEKLKQVTRKRTLQLNDGYRKIYGTTYKSICCVNYA